MRSYKLFLVLLALPFLVIGCATDYKGPDPDFTLKASEAQAEIENFTLVEGYWQQGPTLKMGPQKLSILCLRCVL